ncbi:hypothetical protein [Fodinibius saliphilus]|uniref:hypothetical protein n=1 Tax=Fodinibius saliphilus TaxID=1920650 RepID=UPI0014862823|nr:hypothetical protein [Fodinibius saliphilus]
MNELIHLLAVLGLGFVLSFGMGYRRILKFRHLTQQRVVAGLVTALAVFILLSSAQWLQIITEQSVTQITMLFYCLIGGFFLGFATKMLQLRKQAQTQLYINRSIWTQTAPALIALAIILFGLSRSGILWFSPFTGINLTSGLSLIGFGCCGLTVQIVPEFRKKGIIIIDQFVPWPKVVSYSWQSEQLLQIDYYIKGDILTDFTTYVPFEDRRIIEKLLKKKLEENEEEHKKTITNKA